MSLRFSRKDVLWISGCIFLLVLYGLVQYGSLHGVQYLYAAGHQERLSHWAGVEGGRSLGFYQGILRDQVFGPAAQILSVSLLLLILWRFFQRSRFWVFAGVIFVFLLITKFEALFFPCYGESGSGPVTEAIWLFRHSFDYQGLLNSLNVDQGGPKVYMFSLYPSFVALLLTLIPSIPIFYVVYHGIMFGLGAVVVALFRSLLQKFLDPQAAMLSAVLLLALPLFQTMVELMNMEILCLFFGMMSVYCLGQKKIVPASVAAVLSALAKGPGGIFCATCFAAGVGLFFFDPQEKYRWRNLIAGGIALILGASKLYLLRTYVSPVQMPAGTIRMFIGWQPLMGARWVITFYAGMGVLLLVMLVRETGFQRKKFSDFFTRHYIFALGFIVVSAWIGMYLNISVMGPRYKMIVAPFLILCVVYGLAYLIRRPRWVQGLLTLAILTAALASYGLLCPREIKSDVYSFNNLERSLEYRNDLFMNMKAARIIKDKYASFTIGAPYVIAQQYAMPELGYVKEPLDVVIYGMSVHYADIQNFAGLQSMDLPRTLWIGFRNRPNRYGIDFPIDPQYDQIVHHVEAGDKEIFLFQGGAGIQKMAEKFYKEQLEQIELLKGRRNN